MRLGEQQVEQEARRVLRKLAAARTGLFARGEGHVVARSPAAAATSRVGVAAELVAAFLSRDWIKPDGPGRHVIAGAGLAFLARAQAGGDGFGEQHRLPQSVEREGRTVSVNMGESPLARLKFRDLIDATQFAAGERLRRDFTMAQLTPRLGMDWSASSVSGSRGAARESISDIALAARQRFNRALAAAGPGLGDLLFDVCCHLTPLEGVEAARGWSRRSGRVVLKLALDRLAAHYGFTVVATSAPIRAWSLEEAD